MEKTALIVVTVQTVFDKTKPALDFLNCIQYDKIKGK